MLIFQSVCRFGFIFTSVIFLTLLEKDINFNMSVVGLVLWVTFEFGFLVEKK